MATSVGTRATCVAFERDRNEFRHIVSSLNDQIDIDGKDGRGTLHKDAEAIYMRLLNALFGWELVDANPPGRSAKAIDLIDRKRRIVVQVTSECSSRKISDKTIAKMNEALEGDGVVPYRCEPGGEPYRLKFVFVGHEDETKQRGARKKWKLAEPRGFEFDRETDTIFTSDLTHAFKDLDSARRAEVLELVRGDVGGVGFAGPVQKQSGGVANEMQLVLEIGCDGKSFVPTAKALDVLTEIDADRMNGTGSQAEVSSVKFRYVDLDLIYKMLIGTVRDANGQETVDAGLWGPQLLAYNRTSSERTMEQAVRFAMNDSRIDALSGRADHLIVSEYLKSDNWRGRLHVNEYGLRLPYKRAFLWERVLVRSLAFLKNPSPSYVDDSPQDQDRVHIECACRESRNDWSFISTIHLSREDDSEREKLSWLHCVQFPCDMYDVRTRDLVYQLYPDLCWEVGRLVVTRPGEYDRIVGKYGDEVFHWDNMWFGLL